MPESGVASTTSHTGVENVAVGIRVIRVGHFEANGLDTPMAQNVGDCPLSIDPKRQTLRGTDVLTISHSGDYRYMNSEKG